MTDEQHPAPGYYPDPAGAPDAVRWWDGVQWANAAVSREYAARYAALTPLALPPNARRPWWRHLFWAVPVALVVTLLSIGMVSFALDQLVVALGEDASTDIAASPRAPGASLPPGYDDSMNVDIAYQWVDEPTSDANCPSDAGCADVRLFAVQACPTSILLSADLELEDGTVVGSAHATAHGLERGHTATVTLTSTNPDFEYFVISNIECRPGA